MRVSGRVWFGTLAADRPACQNGRMPRRRQIAWLSAALFTLNAAIAWRMFHVEYLSQTGTGVGAIIAYARYARDYWPDLGWCRFWYVGLPLRNAYVPGAPLAAAILSGFAHISAGRAFYIVMAFMYCLGPVTLFWMALRLTRSASWSFYAGLMYSLISPSAFLVPEIYRDLGGYFRDQRLHVMAGYADNQNVAALTLLPLAILALDVALEKRRPIYFVAAAVALAAGPLTDWPGAIAITFAVLAYGLAQPGAGWLRRWASIAAIGALGYCLAVTWIPPSTVITTQADTQGFVAANRFTPHHLIYAAALAAGVWVLLRLTAAVGAPRYLRFFLLFFFFMAALTLGWYWLGVTLLAQPHRFHLASAPADTGHRYYADERVQDRAVVRPTHARQPRDGAGFDHVLDERLHRYAATYRLLSTRGAKPDRARGRLWDHDGPDRRESRFREQPALV
jgi:hypothetical protein